ncbi:hypothetical protein [Kaarinaea lacus]
MNKQPVEKFLTQVQLALIPAALFLLLLTIALDARAASDDNPSMELLEFLGEWQTKDGEWVDPMRFLTVSDSDLNRDPVTKVNVKEEKQND